MRRGILIVVAGASLAGCSSLSLDAFKSAPPTMQVALESNPPGADARTSVGPGCKTPCSVEVQPPENGFSVTYTLAKYQVATIPVQVIRTPGEFFSAGTTKIDPNPVTAELQPLAPPPKPVARKKVMRPKRPKVPKANAAAPAEAPFPDATQPAQPAAPQQAAPSR